MASSVIGALRVNLGIDSAQFQNGLKQAQTGLDRFAKVAVAGFAAVAAAGTAMAGALAVGIKKTIDEADDMSKAAQKFGIGVEELSRLKHAADLSGVSLETLGKGIQRLSRNMIDAEQGLKSPMRAFDALGISIKNADGTLKTSSQVLTEVAGRFAAMEDGVAKTGLAMTLFGRAGAELIPMFNGGAAGLREMMEEAEKLGIVLDSKTGRAAEAFNDNLTRMERAKDGVILKITAALLPSLELLSEKFLAVAADGEKITAMSSGVVRALGWIANEVAQVAILSARLSAEFAGVMEALSRLNNYDFSGAWAAFQEGQNASAAMAAQIKADIEGIFDGTNISQGGIQRRIDEAFGTAGANAGEKFVANFETAVAGSAPRVKAATDAWSGLRKVTVDNKDSLNELGQVGQSVASSLSSAFMGLIDGSRKVSDVLKNLLSQFASMAVSSVFQSLVGGIFGGFKIPGFAAGTNSAPRGFAMVGERGPELVHFGGGERVIPNHELGGGGRSVVEIRMSPDVESRVLEQAGNQSVQIVQAAAPGIVKGSVSAVQQTSRNKPGFFR